MTRGAKREPDADPGTETSPYPRLGFQLANMAVLKGLHAMNIGVHVSLSILVSLVCMPSTGIAGS